MFNIAHPYLSLIASIAVGLLVGMERGWTQRNFGKGRRVAGFRTFGLIGLLGGLGGLAPDMVAAALGLGVAAVLTVGYSRSADQDHLSATTTLAGLLTFGAGFCATRLSPALGLATGAAIFAILSSRQSMHALLRGMDESEIEGVSRFLLVSLVILPLLPDASYGPYDAWNPRKIWMVVVFVMGLSFAGYAISRRFGRDRGVLLVALTGAIVSSTAVTADYARRLRDEPDGRGLLTAGIAVASIVMFVRVQLVALVLVPRALPSLALTMAPAALVAVAFALTAWRAHGKGGNGAAVANPLGFTPRSCWLPRRGIVARRALGIGTFWAAGHGGSPHPHRHIGRRCSRDDDGGAPPTCDRRSNRWLRTGRRGSGQHFGQSRHDGGHRLGPRRLESRNTAVRRSCSGGGEPCRLDRDRLTFTPRAT